MWPLTWWSLTRWKHSGKMYCCLLWHHKDMGLSWGPWWNEDQELTARCPHLGSPVEMADEMTWNLLNCTNVNRCSTLHRGHVNIELLAHPPPLLRFLNLAKHLFPFTMAPSRTPATWHLCGPCGRCQRQRCPWPVFLLIGNERNYGSWSPD